MAVTIRLSKTGRKGERKYRIVVKEKRSKRDGQFIELLGWYEKKEKKVLKNIDTQRYKHWKALGAKPSEKVRQIVEL